MTELADRKRILIVGCCGAGKTVLASELGKRLGLPVHHLDRLWWTPGWVEKPRDVFDAELAELLRQERWIIDGNYNRTLAERLKFADFVIVLNFSRWICLWRIVRRFWRYRRGTRPDMGAGCRERLNREFLCYVWEYRSRMFPRVLETVAESRVPVRIVDSPRELSAWVEEQTPFR